MKKILIFLSAIGLSIGLYAKPEKGGKKPGSKEGRPSREEIIKKFDKDGDGKLNEEEKAEPGATRITIVVASQVIGKTQQVANKRINEKKNSSPPIFSKISLSHLPRGVRNRNRRSLSAALASTRNPETRCCACRRNLSSSRPRPRLCSPCWRRL